MKDPASSAAIAWQRFRQHRLAMVAGLLLIVLTGLTLSAPLVGWVLGTDAEAIDLGTRLAGPSLAHPLGTDEIGRDLLLRLLEGGKISLAIGLGAALIATLIGIGIGLVAGCAGGWLDALLMRFTDFVIALPILPLLIVMAAADLSRFGLDPDRPETAVGRIVFILALVGWTTVARLARGSALVVREHEFVHASRAVGAAPLQVLTRHILPNAVSPVIVATALSVGNLVLVESVLSFLGLGIQPPMASWGSMLTGAQATIGEAPMLAFWPGALIFLTVVAFNVVGDGIRDALDVETDLPGH